MAIWYVDDSATGLGTGLNWTDAYTVLITLLNTETLAAGDEIRIAHTHAETKTTNTSIRFDGGTFAGPIKLISTDPATDLPRIGASHKNSDNLVSAGTNIETSSQTVDLFVYIYGVEFGFDDFLSIGQNAQVDAEFDQCTFHAQRDASGGAIGWQCQAHDGEQHYHFRFNDCTWKFDCDGAGFTGINIGGNRATHQIHNRPVFDFSGSTKTPTRLISGQSNTNSSKATIIVDGADLSEIPSLIRTQNPINHAFLHLKRCIVHPTVDWIVEGSPGDGEGSQILAEHCTVGTGELSFTPLGLTYFENHFGSIQATTDKWRVGGANDGAQQDGYGYSYEITPNSNIVALYRPLVVPVIVGRVTANSRSIVVHIAGDESLNGNEFWVEVAYPTELPNPDGQGTWVTTKPEPNATPVALNTDETSSWVGNTVSVQQEIVIPIRPTLSGLITLRCYLAKNTTNPVALCPYADVREF